MKKGENQKFGFTIIEVSLVLAVAGLIFLMVFIALPQLQRQQRDTRRKEDIFTFLEAVKKYQTNNRGVLPTDWSAFQNSYLGSSFKDPGGNDYELTSDDCKVNNGDDKCVYAEPSIMDYKLRIYSGATCKGVEAHKSSNPRNIAVLYKLEGEGMYCANT